MNNDPQQPFQPVEPTQPSPITSAPTDLGFDTPPPLKENPFIVTPPPKKSRKGLIIGLIVAIVIIGLGIAAYFLFFQPKDTSTTTTDTTETTEEVTDRATVITTKIKAAIDTDLSTKYPLLTLSERSGAPIYQAPKLAYAVASSDFGKTLDIDSKATDLKVGYTDLEKSIKGVLDSEPGLKATTNEWQSVYQDKSVICTLYLSTSPSTVTCANIADYKPLIDQVAPFAAAYVTAYPDDKAILAYNTPKITQKGNGFASASIAISSADGGAGGFAGLFYAKDTEWTYWKGTQSVLLCSDYNTPDLQYAFTGDTCEDAAGQMSTVKTAIN